MNLKIVLAGPQGTGKTNIANFISGHCAQLTSDTYTPTVGVRILELETQIKGIQDTINIELWDLSGDYQYENCWKATMLDSDGIVLIYNPDAPSQEQQLNDWFDFFVKRNNMRDEQCLILAHRTGNVGGNTVSTAERFRPPPLFSRVSAGLTSNESDSDIKTLFENFIRELCSVKSKMANQQRK